MFNPNPNTPALENALAIIRKYIPPDSDEATGTDEASGNGEGFNADGATGGEAMSFEELIAFLASLPPHEYEAIRKEVARMLNIKVSTLDNYVKNARKINSGGDGAPFPKVEPWPDPVEPHALLLEIGWAIRRFIVCEPETSFAATLWAAMTWFIDDIKVAPMALITAPEKRCGKTQLLSIFGRLCNRPLPSSNISPAALFRSIDKWKPTLLIDEVDAFMRDNEELRGLLNAGHTRDSAFTVRCVGDNHEPTNFNLWGAKALAGIGKLADTLMDRSIILELRRKCPDEKVERLRHAPEGLFETLQRKLARFAKDYGATVGASRPEIPEELNDRAQDNWEPLLAIADIAGGHFSRFARKAAIKLSASNENTTSLGVELLTDIYEVFEAKEIDRIFSHELVKALCEDNEKRWATYNFRGPNRCITPKQLGQLLSAYGITSRNIRGCLLSVKKGYYRSQFEDAFQRYVPSYSPPPETGATSATSQETTEKASAGAAFTVAAENATEECVADVEDGGTAV